MENVAAPVEWKCALNGLDGDGKSTGAAPEGLTVGSKFLLSCEGPPAPLDKAKLALVVAKQDRYLLRLLETRSLTDTRGEFVATSWASGQITFPGPILSDGATRVNLGEIKLSVASVLDPQKNPEMKPFPPWGPVALAWPAWVWLAIALFAAAMVALISWRLKRSLRRKRLLQLLEKNPIVGEPYHHFNKELRRLTRQVPVESGAWSLKDKGQYLHEIDQALRWYLARELVLPAFDRSTSEMARDLKDLDKSLHGRLKRDFTVAFTELESAIRRPERVNVEDAHQITELARTLADRVRESAAAPKRARDAKGARP